MSIGKIFVFFYALLVFAFSLANSTQWNLITSEQLRTPLNRKNVTFYEKDLLECVVSYEKIEIEDGGDVDISTSLRLYQVEGKGFQIFDSIRFNITELPSQYNFSHEIKINGTGWIELISFSRNNKIILQTNLNFNLRYDRGEIVTKVNYEISQTNTYAFLLSEFIISNATCIKVLFNRTGNFIRENEEYSTSSVLGYHRFVSLSSTKTNTNIQVSKMISEFYQPALKGKNWIVGFYFPRKPEILLEYSVFTSSISSEECCANNEAETYFNGNTCIPISLKIENKTTNTNTTEEEKEGESSIEENEMSTIKSSVSSLEIFIIGFSSFIFVLLLVLIRRCPYHGYQWKNIFSEFPNNEPGDMTDMNDTDGAMIKNEVIESKMRKVVYWFVEAKVQIEERETKSCSICLELGCNTALSCLHIYHKDCIIEWGKKNKTCPNCREKLDLEQAFYLSD